MRVVTKLYTFVVNGAGWFGALLLFLIAFATVADVILRNVTGRGLRWQIDFAEYALFISTFLMAPWIMSLGAHVRVDFLVRTLPERISRHLDNFANVVGAALCALLTWYALSETLDSMSRGTLVLKSVVFPEWWAMVVMPFSFALLCVEFILRFAGYRRVHENVSV